MLHVVEGDRLSIGQFRFGAEHVLKIVDDRAGDARQLHLVDVGKADPGQVLQFLAVGNVFRVGADLIQKTGKKARVEPPALTGWRDRPRHVAERGEVRCKSAFGKAGPVGMEPDLAVAGDDETCLLKRLADGGDGERLRPRRGHRAIGPRHEALDHGLFEGLCDADARVGPIATPSGKHVEIRHERMGASTLADEESNVRPGTVEEDDRSGILRPQQGMLVRGDIACANSGRLVARHASHVPSGPALIGHLVQRIVLAAEAMHTQGPLQTDDATFQRLHARHRQDQCHRDPERKRLPRRPVNDAFPEHVAGNHNVADDEDSEIGRQVVGAVVMHRFAARSAVIDRLQERAEQLSFAAGRTAGLQATHDRPSKRARSTIMPVVCRVRLSESLHDRRSLF
ncbi:hypothetical protein RHIZ404_210446 [Rhizobium sp. EC-SD404]|nr:hypothetical protein RHIZ404_210446 [Rhizobium sp. EC-SD404]